jgi:hypothetical protein
VIVVGVGTHRYETNVAKTVFVFIGTEVSLANVASVIRVLAVNTHIVAAPVTIVILISCVYAAAHNRFTVVAEVILISIRAGGQND